MKTSSKVITAAVVTLALGAGAAVTFLLHGPDGPPQQDMTIGDAVRREVVDSAIAALNAHYVFPDKAAAMAADLRARADRHEFDGITSAQAFAEALTQDLQQVTGDRHLEARYFEKTIAPLAPGQDDAPEEKAQELARFTRLNFGFETVGRLKYNIGYIDLHAFARPQQTVERIAAAMTLLADTRALIIDLRKCGGGDPETVMLLASYLFDKPTHLNDIYWRDENRTDARWTSAQVAGKRYGETRKLYILTSEDTFSAGEDFSYALKNSGRATLVGETTGGGAHPGNPRRLSDHFMLFVPNGRPINPVTQSDWEGVGVVPDVKTRASRALDAAQVAILRERLATETDPRERAGLADRIAELD